VGWLLRVEHRLLGRLRVFLLQYLRFSGVERGGMVGGGLGTLLGPEGAGKSFCHALQRRPQWSFGVGVVVVRLGLVLAS
jgi:hypothetical protein